MGPFARTLAFTACLIAVPMVQVPLDRYLKGRVAGGSASQPPPSDLGDALLAAVQRQRLAEGAAYGIGGYAESRGQILPAPANTGHDEFAEAMAARASRSSVDARLAASESLALPGVAAATDMSGSAALQRPSRLDGYAPLPPPTVPRIAESFGPTLNVAGPGQYSGSNGDTYAQAGPHGIINNRTGQFSVVN